MALAGQADIPCIVLAGEVTERMEQAWICEAIHDPDEEKMLDSFVTKQRLTRRAEQIVRRLQETEDR